MSEQEYDDDFERKEGAEPLVELVVNLDEMQLQQTYTFSPPMHIANVSMVSKHFMGNPPSMRHANFLQNDIREAGLREGQLVYINETEKPGYRIPVFACQARFHNRTTGKMEIARYTVSCKVKREAVDGIKIHIQQKIDQTLKQNTDE